MSMIFSVKKIGDTDWVEVVLIFENPIHHYLKRPEIQPSIDVLLLR